MEHQTILDYSNQARLLLRQVLEANPFMTTQGDTTMDGNAFALGRRSFLQLGAAGVTGLSLFPAAAGEPSQTAKKENANRGQPTKFQVACMTLPYSQFPLERALTGLQSAGYRYVAWGTTHLESDGKRVQVMPTDGSPEKARDLGKQCRDRGLEPLMMFSGIYPESENHLEVMRSRIRQASAAGIGQVLTFGNTRGGDRKRWVEHFKQLGRLARGHGVLIVIKPHGGLTANGVLAAEIVREVADDGVKVNYDAGNVMDYLDIEAVVTLADLAKCAAEVHSFCIKDHRNWPKDQDCGPGFGEIDHYRLLSAVAFTGRAIPLCCENISAPLVPYPKTAEGIDALARRAREFLEVVVQGVQAV